MPMPPAMSAKRPIVVGRVDERASRPPDRHRRTRIEGGRAVSIDTSPCRRTEISR